MRPAAKCPSASFIKLSRGSLEELMLGYRSSVVYIFPLLSQNAIGIIWLSSGKKPISTEAGSPPEMSCERLSSSAAQPICGNGKLSLYGKSVIICRCTEGEIPYPCHTLSNPPLCDCRKSEDGPDAWNSCGPCVPAGTSLCSRLLRRLKKPRGNIGIISSYMDCIMRFCLFSQIY